MTHCVNAKTQVTAIFVAIFLYFSVLYIFNICFPASVSLNERVNSAISDGNSSMGFYKTS